MNDKGLSSIELIIIIALLFLALIIYSYIILVIPKVGI